MAYDWRYENSIMNGKKIDVDDEYSKYRINLILSNYKDTILYANEMNINGELTDQMHYDYLYNSIRKVNRRSKKQTKEEKRARDSENELISLISEYYKYNIVRAKEALKVLSDEQIDIIRRKLNKGGVK